MEPKLYSNPLSDLSFSLIQNTIPYPNSLTLDQKKKNILHSLLEKIQSLTLTL